jgi:hypothetical protein
MIAFIKSNSAFRLGDFLLVVALAASRAPQRSRARNGGDPLSAQARSHDESRLLYDHYRVDDFAFGQDTLSRLDLAGALLLGNVYRPYTMNTVSLRLNYAW